MVGVSWLVEPVCQVSGGKRRECQALGVARGRHNVGGAVPAATAPTANVGRDSDRVLRVRGRRRREGGTNRQVGREQDDRTREHCDTEFPNADLGDTQRFLADGTVEPEVRQVRNAPTASRQGESVQGQHAIRPYVVNRACQRFAGGAGRTSGRTWPHLNRPVNRRCPSRSGLSASPILQRSRPGGPLPHWQAIGATPSAPDSFP